MIILDLQCTNHHRFEGWFASRQSFDAQVERGEIRCALCHSDQVAALPSGPLVLRNHQSGSMAASVPDAAQESFRKIYQALAAIARKADDVGERFPEEARRIHYEEVPARSIRGQATQDETHALLEEGILVLPVPVPPESETH